MAEHQIRFRGGWEWHGTTGEAGFVRRLTLPTDWPPDVESPFRLVRRFGRPPFDPSTESARLELIEIPGLVVARLNGRDLGRPIPGAASWSIPLGGMLLSRNILEIDVNFGEPPVAAKGWGSIALVLGLRDFGDPALIIPTV